MIPKELSDKILTIGPAAKPQGGIAQVIINYMTEVFTTMPRIEFNAGQKGAVLKNIIAFVWSLIKELWILLSNRRIKIVHFHTAAGITFIRVSIGWVIAKIFSKKTIIHIHAGAFPVYYRKHSRYVKFVLKHSDRVVALSKEWYNFYTQEVGLNNVYIINNVISTPKKVSVSKDRLLHLLFLGHLIENKGIFDLLQVMIDYHNQYINRLVLHIGGCFNENRIQEIIEDNKLSDIVRFEGWVTGERKIELLNLCDVFVLPSYIEGLPLSILECMSYKMPIISTTVGGIPSIVETEINGYLFPPGDRDSLAKSIEIYLNTPSLVDKHGRESRKRVECFLPENVSVELERLYLDILDSNK